MSRLVELGHNIGEESNQDPLYSVPGIVLESVGPVRHEVKVPFHDSQVKGHAVLIQTGWDIRFGTEAYWEPGPFLSDDVIHGWMRMLLAVLLGNLIYWSATPFLPDFLVHDLYKLDAGLLLDFGICTTAYLFLKGG